MKKVVYAVLALPDILTSAIFHVIMIISNDKRRKNGND